MSVPELFIRRPVMTTLVMSGILLFGLIGYPPVAGERSAERGLSDHPGLGQPARRQPRNDGFVRGHAAGKTIFHHRGRGFNVVHQRAGSCRKSRFNSRSTATLTRRRRTCRRPSRARRNNCRRTCPRPPTYQKVNPADSPVIYLAMSSPTLPLSTVDDYAENMLAQRISMVNGVAQVSVFGSQQYAVRIQVDPNKLAAYGLGIDQVEQAVEAGNVNQPLGTLYGKHQAFTVQANGQLNERGGVPADDCRLSQRQSRCACRNWATCSTACRTTRWPAGITTRAPSCWPCSASRARTRSKSWTTSKNCCRSSARQFRRRSNWTFFSTAR